MTDAVEKTEKETQAQEIMTKPLPQILREFEEKVKAADDAARDARAAAEEARVAGEKAANEAAKVAAEAIARVEEVAKNAEKALPAALVRKVLGSGTFLAVLLVLFLASIIGAVAISLGLSLGIR